MSRLQECLRSLDAAIVHLGDLLAGGKLANVDTREQVLRQELSNVAVAAMGLRRAVGRAEEAGVHGAKAELASRAADAIHLLLPQREASWAALVTAAKVICARKSPLRGELQRALSAEVLPDPGEPMEQAGEVVPTEDSREMISMADAVRLFQDDFKDPTSVRRFAEKHRVEMEKPSGNRRVVDLAGLARALLSNQGSTPSDEQIGEYLDGIRARQDLVRQRRDPN